LKGVTTGNEYGAFDETTGKCVETQSTRCPAPATRATPPGQFWLFDSKHVGSFNTHTECVAFMKGVEAVLSYMLEAKDVNGLKSVLDHMLEAKDFGNTG
jgi:hypothetical protein